jgi:hypothetical protein
MARVRSVMLLALSALPPARAYRRWLLGLPSSNVPCVDSSGAALASGCHGTRTCEAFGHSDCVVYQGGADVSNAFGALFAAQVAVSRPLACNNSQ